MTLDQAVAKRGGDAKRILEHALNRRYMAHRRYVADEEAAATFLEDRDTVYVAENDKVSYEPSGGPDLHHLEAGEPYTGVKAAEEITETYAARDVFQTTLEVVTPLDWDGYRPVPQADEPGFLLRLNYNGHGVQPTGNSTATTGLLQVGGELDGDVSAALNYVDEVFPNDQFGNSAEPETATYKANGGAPETVNTDVSMNEITALLENTETVTARQKQNGSYDPLKVSLTGPEMAGIDVVLGEEADPETFDGETLAGYFNSIPEEYGPRNHQVRFNELGVAPVYTAFFDITVPDDGTYRVEATGRIDGFDSDTGAEQYLVQEGLLPEA